MAIWQYCIAKYLLAIWRYFISKYTLAIWGPLIAQTETIELVAFIGLEGVNYVFTHISHILVTTFLF
jgi:hypothetical protein